MELTVRYTGSWFRPDVALYALISCFFAATQLHEISQAMHKPILDLPDVHKSWERYRSE